ncbi:aspartate carbamoyltransferase [bacterium]|jgi:aspartate carbamoyltransferase catalytic subunit|nr:aspartate carbamoyltransferase [bacterium]MBT6831594.1 aspartate carbamoyltransferase [bacterium]MBT6995889.1 aspartate carbamoyltransferase [bacterium]MBT7772663.1 aspartate carbamoyltransferase [bacterium]
MKHILSAAQFDRAELEKILALAARMAENLKSDGTRLADGKILATLFYEPSTRTRLSFETAMLRIGGHVISTPDTKFSSVQKGETVEDTIRILSGFADVIAMRSSEIGFAERAAKVSAVPILNAGDGAGEHPTQSLLDLFTISKYFSLDKKICVTFVGDLKFGRTVHSLTTVLRNFPNVQLRFVAPDELKIPEKYRQPADEIFTEISPEILKTTDVLYVTRVQEERFADRAQYERLRDTFIFDAEKISQLPKKSIVLHPLPRINEISPEVDALPQAKYFEQARNGVPVRMALISYVLNLIG